MDNKGKTVIIKKIKRGHGSAHGGSWKVAYADFVTAMMAFFLLMWLLSMTSDEKRARLAEYFKNFSIFDQAGTSFLEQNSNIKQETGGEIQAEKEKTKGLTEITPKDLAEKLKKAVKERLAGLENQVIIELAEDGVRIQIIDPDGSLFPAGSAEPTPKLKQILKVVGDNIKIMSNMIALEGHTDASPYNVGKSTNWELSSQRASAARFLLGEYGVEPDRVARVVGFADKQLYISNDPKDPRNRRISILVMQDKIDKPEHLKVEQPPAPPQPGLNIIEPKMSPEERERRIKELRKEMEEKNAAAQKTEKPKSAPDGKGAPVPIQPPAQAPKPATLPPKASPVPPKGTTVQPVAPKAVAPKTEPAKGAKPVEKPSGMEIIEPKASPGKK